MVDYSQIAGLGCVCSTHGAHSSPARHSNRKRREMVSLQSLPAMSRRFIAAIGVILLSSLFANAQFDTGTITGLVTDPSGAAVTNATVVVTNTETSFQKAVQTNSAGGFTVSALPFGNYVVSATASNFAEAK